MDVTQALKNAENALRDFITQVLINAYGKEWISKCGVTKARIAKWYERKEIDSKRQVTGVIEERILYYSDFYDIKTILKKHWSEHFAKAFGDWKPMDIWLSELEKLRDPDAHRRELLPHQQHLAIGISGEIRSRISRFRSSLETGESYFPRIESARDSLGTIYTPDTGSMASSGKILLPGDFVDFVITANDPLGSELLYSISFSPSLNWQKSNSASIMIDNTNVGLRQPVYLAIKSQREFHANDEHDDLVTFLYDILPPTK